MFKKGEIIEINIDSLAYGGEGIGRYQGIAVFIPDTVPGDKVKAEIVTAKKNFARAVLKEIVEPSVNRIKPVCALANACGGCQWQHIKYEEQLQAKKKIVQDSLNKIANLDITVLDVLKSDCITEYRCKVQYPVQQTKVSKRVLAGYYKEETHEVVNIKYCPVQPDIINKITEFIRDEIQKSGLNAYNEKTKTGLIRHLVYRYSATNKNLILTIVINSQAIPENLRKLAASVQDKFKEIIGVFANLNTFNTNVILGRTTELIQGQETLEETLDGKKFIISAGSFFQVNPTTATKIFNTVRNMIADRIENPTILDVYAGVGTFSIWLKDMASSITAIEENPQAISDARENIKLNKSKGEPEIEIIEGNADNVLLELVNQNRSFDVTILDPPRKGCSTVALNSIISLTNKYIIYVSCNPTTLARDIKILNDQGFTPEFVQPVDMFCHTYHIESIAILKKSI